MIPQVKDSSTDAISNACDQHRFEGATDGELVAIYLSTNSKSALETLVRRHAGMVQAVIRRIVPNPADAEDAFQVTFLVFIRSARKIRKHSSLSAWLYGVAYRTACRVRSRGYQQRTSSLEESDCPPGDHRDLLTKFAQDSQLEFLDRELQVLSSPLREVIVDHHLLGHTASQIADRMDISVSAVEGRLRRGRAALRQALARRGVSFSVAAAIAATQFQDAHAAISSSLADSLVQPDWLSSLINNSTTASLTTSRQLLVTKELSMPTSMISKATLAATLAACSVAAIAVPSMYYGPVGSAQSSLLASSAIASEAVPSDLSLGDLPADTVTPDLGVQGVFLVNDQTGSGEVAQGIHASPTGGGGATVGIGGGASGGPGGAIGGGSSGPIAGGASGPAGGGYGGGYAGSAPSGSQGGSSSGGPAGGGPVGGAYGTGFSGGPGGPGGPGAGLSGGGPLGSGSAPTNPGGPAMGGSSGGMAGGFAVGGGGFMGAGMGGMGGGGLGGEAPRPNRTFVSPGKTKPNWLTRGGTLAEEKSEGREQTRLKIREKVTPDFNNVALRSVLAQLSEATNVTILLDEPALESAGAVTPDDPVTLNIGSVSLQRALEIILEPLELTYVVEPEGLHITTKDAGAARQRRFYDLAYIATDEESAAGVHDLIVELIASDDEPIHRLGSMLIVDGTEQTHQQIEEVLSQLAQMPPDNLQGVSKPAPATTGGMF